MEYTVHELAHIAGISPRTVRHYDAINLVKPARHSGSGYHLYGYGEVNQLQHILFYRELGLSLPVIRDIMRDPAFDGVKALQEHWENLLTKRRQLDVLIANVDRTIAATEGRVTMSDTEKCEGFKRQLITDNEAQYGPEIREKYGDDVVESSDSQVQHMTSDDYAEWARLDIMLAPAPFQRIFRGLS